MFVFVYDAHFDNNSTLSVQSHTHTHTHARVDRLYHVCAYTLTNTALHDINVVSLTQGNT